MRKKKDKFRIGDIVFLHDQVVLDFWPSYKDHTNRNFIVAEEKDSKGYYKITSLDEDGVELIMLPQYLLTERDKKDDEIFLGWLIKQFDKNKQA